MNTPMSFQFHIPTRILFGAGQVKTLHKQALPGKKALLVLSNGTSTRRFGYLGTVQQELDRAGVAHAVFDQIQPNPTRDNVMAGAACARENGCDFVLGLGGGSCLDAAKAIAAMATNEGDLWDYIHGGTGKGQALARTPLPIVAISTTAGTGSEADAYGVITNEETHEKIGYGGLDSLYPVLAVVDPEMMTSVPAQYTAFQGFDALFHSTEGYLARAGNCFTDMCALETIENVARYLPRAVADGGDLEARARVAFGNTLSGFVMSVGGTTSEHSLEHALSASHPNLPHGAGLIMISRAFYTHFAQTVEANWKQKGAANG